MKEITKINMKHWVVSGLRAEIAQKEKEIEDLRDQLRAVIASTKDENTPKKKRGRPRKIAAKNTSKKKTPWTSERREAFIRAMQARSAKRKKNNVTEFPEQSQPDNADAEMHAAEDQLAAAEDQLLDRLGDTVENGK